MPAGDPGPPFPLDAPAYRGQAVSTYKPLEPPTFRGVPYVSAPAEENPKASQATRDGKVPLDLLEYAAEVEIAKAMHTGAVKYGRRNYRTIEIHATTYIAALKRHIGAWASGEDLDPESGLSHLAHIGANVNVLLGAIDAGTLHDDRAPATRSEIQELQSQRSNAQHSGGA